MRRYLVVLCGLLMVLAWWCALSRYMSGYSSVPLDPCCSQGADSPGFRFPAWVTGPAELLIGRNSSELSIVLRHHFPLSKRTFALRVGQVFLASVPLYLLR